MQNAVRAGRVNLLRTILILIGLIVVVGTIVAIARIIQGQASPGAQIGVGADGFRAYVEDTTNLGVDSLVSKDQVSAALGGEAKSVRPAEVSKVFNLNGNRGQTITFSFVRSDGTESFIHIDKRIYKDTSSIESDNVYRSSLQYGSINGKTVYVKRAQTIGGFREYHALIVNDTTVYRFVLAQPLRKITIKEVKAIDILKEIMTSARI